MHPGPAEPRCTSGVVRQRTTAGWKAGHAMSGGALDLLDIETLAREFGVDARTVLRWRKGPRPLPAIKVRRRVLFIRTEVLDWLRSQRESPPSRARRKVRKANTR